MDAYLPLRNFVSEWACYLAQRGHRVSSLPGALEVLCSRNGRDVAYRWLLLHAKRDTRRLTAIEHENIQRHLRRGRQAAEQVFVVIKFDRPEPRVVVLPAAKAIKVGRLRSDRGGIPWKW